MYWKNILSWLIIAILCASMLLVPLIGVASAADGDLIFSTTITWSDMNLNSVSIGESGTIYLYPYNTSTLYAFYPNGSEKWNVNVGAGDYQADPVVDKNEVIYVANKNNEVRAIYPNSTVKYTTDINDFTGCDGQLSIDSNNQLYLTDGYYIYCLDENGNLQWNVSSPTGSGTYTPGSISDTNDMVYFGTWFEGAFALNTADGSTAWMIDGIYEYIYHTPGISFDESTLYALTGDGSYAKLWAFNALTGALQWEYNTTDRIYARTPPTVLSDGAIVFGGHECWEPDALYCVESDGTLRWRQEFPLHSQVESGIIELEDGSLITVQDADLFSINSATGAMTKIYDTGGSTNRYGTPAVASNGNIFFTIDSDTFYGVEGSSAAKYNYADYIAGDVPNNFHIWHNQYEEPTDPDPTPTETHVTRVPYDPPAPTPQPQPLPEPESPLMQIIEEFVTFVLTPFNWFLLLFAYLGAFLGKNLSDNYTEDVKEIIADTLFYGTIAWILVLIVNIFIPILSMNELFIIWIFGGAGFVLTLAANCKGPTKKGVRKSRKK